MCRPVLPAQSVCLSNDDELIMEQHGPQIKEPVRTGRRERGES